MALDFEVENLDNVPEAFRGEYAPTADGARYRLAVNGVEDVSGLKKALAAERNLLPEAKQLAASLKAIGKLPSEAAQVLSAAEARALEAEQSERTFLADATVEAALSNGKVTAEGMRLLRPLLVARVKIEKGPDGKRVATILAEDGKTPMAGTGPNGRATFADLVKSTIAQYPGQFQASGSGGSGAPRRQGERPSAGTLTRGEYEKLPAYERAAALRTMKLVD